MKPRNIEAIFRLTPLQEGLLFHTLEDPEAGAYFDQYSATINGKLNAELLREAWQGVVDSHASLRTFFTWEKRDNPLQVVREKVTVPFVFTDLSVVSEEQQKARIMQYLTDDRREGFVLDQSPLMRVQCFKLSDSATRMVWSFHHLILDGWSVRLVLSELTKRYHALAVNAPLTISSAPTFEQFVSWQSRQNASEAEDYWRTYLAGFTTPSTPRVARLTTSGNTETGSAGGGEHAVQTTVSISTELGGRLTKFARDSQVTLNTLFVAAWGQVVSRYCDLDDVVFGTTSAGRPPTLKGVEGTAGLFITTLPMRVNTTQNPSVSELLNTIQKDQMRQRDVDHVGLNVIQKASAVPSGVPLFETLLVFENFPAFHADDEMSFTLDDELFSEYSHYPLALLVVPGETTQLIAVHQPDVYSVDSVLRMLASLETALEGLLADTQVANVDVLATDERASIASAAQGANVSIASTSVLTEFKRCVSLNSQRVAVSCGDQQFTYADIDALSDRLAARLATDAYSATCAVAIVCERNHWPVAMQLAAMKAGKIYVTLDAKDPASRIDFVLSDLSEALGEEGKFEAVLATTQLLSGNYEALSSKHARLLVDSVDSLPTEAQVVERIPHADSPAYVIYTSGSTGRPKGVLVSHGNLANSTLARNHFYPKGPKAFALLSSLATDSSIAGVFWSLCTGGSLVMPQERAELDVTTLVELFVAQKVTHTLCVPSLYALMLDALEFTRVPSLEAVIVAGEACPLSVVKRHGALLGNVSLYNEYGPSEACVWVTASLLSASADTISIGRPVCNTQALVLDGRKRLAPLGVAGELYVSGANTALGYINSQYNNDDAFPTLDNHGGVRFYRTGDRVVLKDDGELEYIGRVDSQLKVRGFRVEPGEVEAAICLHADVQAAVVLVDDSDLDGVLDDLMVAAPSSHAALLAKTINEIEQLDDEQVDRALNQLSAESESK